MCQPQPKERGNKESIQVAAFIAFIGGIAGLVASTLGLVCFDLSLLEALGIYCASGFSVFALGISLLAFHDYRNENAGGLDRSAFSDVGEAYKT